MNLLDLIIDQTDNDELRQKLKTIHPRQLICNETIDFGFYEISYEYDTVRGHHRDNATKIMIHQMPINRNKKQVPDKTFRLFLENSIKEDFISYIKNFNKNNPMRALLNVKVLSVACIGSSTLI